MLTLRLTPEHWAALGPTASLLSLLLAALALAQRWRGSRTPHTASAPLRFSPRLVPPVLLLAVLALTAAAWLIALVRWGAWWGLLATPLVLGGVERLLMRLARQRYQQRLAAQIPDAVETLASLTSGAAGVLGAFRRVAASSPAPLGVEWRWVEQQINQPLLTTVAGRPVTQITDHAVALRALAEQTPLLAHAAVLRHLAAIYAQGAESLAPARLEQLSEVLRQQAQLRRAVQLGLGRIRAQAYIVVGAIGLILAWLAWSQPVRVHAAFVDAPWGLIATAWIALWMSAPLLVGWLVGRTPDLPL